MFWGNSLKKKLNVHITPAAECSKRRGKEEQMKPMLSIKDTASIKRSTLCDSFSKSKMTTMYVTQFRKTEGVKVVLEVQE